MCQNPYRYCVSPEFANIGQCRIGTSGVRLVIVVKFFFFLFLQSNRLNSLGVQDGRPLCTNGWPARSWSELKYVDVLKDLKVFLITNQLYKIFIPSSVSSAVLLLYSAAMEDTWW